MKLTLRFLLLIFVTIFPVLSFAQPTVGMEAQTHRMTEFESVMKSAVVLVDHAREFRKLEVKLGHEKYVELVGGQTQADTIESWAKDVSVGLDIKFSSAGFFLQILDKGSKAPDYMKYYHELAVTFTGKTIEELANLAVLLIKKDVEFLKKRKPPLPLSPQN